MLGEISPRAPFWVAAALRGVAFLYGWFMLPESLPKEKRMAFSWRRANPVRGAAAAALAPGALGLSVVNFLLTSPTTSSRRCSCSMPATATAGAPWEVGMVLALVGALDVVVQGVLIGPVVKRFGDRATMVLGLFGGARRHRLHGPRADRPAVRAGHAAERALGLAMPTLQSLMTQRVSEASRASCRAPT